MSTSDYRQDLHRYLRARGNLFASLTRHPTLLGGSREHALAELLRPIVPRRFEILTGTIASPPEHEQSPCQVDLMVVNTMDYPTIVKDGAIAVVLPESVEIVVEVKTNLSGPVELRKALEQIRRIHRASSPPPLSVLFSYDYPAKLDTLRRNLAEAISTPPPPLSITSTGAAPPDADTWDKSDLPNLIVTDKGLIAEKRGDGRFIYLDNDPFNYLLHKVITQLLPPRTQTSQAKRISAGARSIDALLEIEPIFVEYSPSDSIENEETP